MSYGESWVDWSLPEEEAIKQIKTAYEFGINVSLMCSFWWYCYECNPNILRASSDIRHRLVYLRLLVKVS